MTGAADPGAGHGDGLDGVREAFAGLKRGGATNGRGPTPAGSMITMQRSSLSLM